MSIKKNSVIVSMLLLAIFLCSAAALAESAQDLKDRMRTRLPEINQLKDSGMVGETSSGFLAMVSGAAATPLVSAENADRAKVYAAIAAQQGTTPELVGQRRALQITGIATPGSWLQDANGAWYQK